MTSTQEAFHLWVISQHKNGGGNRRKERKFIRNEKTKNIKGNKWAIRIKLRQEKEGMRKQEARDSISKGLNQITAHCVEKMKEHKRNNKKKGKPIFTRRRSLRNETQAGLAAALILFFSAYIPACFPLWLQLSPNLRNLLYLPLSPTLLPGSNTMVCDWMWSVCICTKDRPRREARPRDLRERRALHQYWGPFVKRHRPEMTEAGPPQRQVVWKQRADSLNLSRSDIPKSWLESGGNLGEASKTGLPHMGRAAARSTRSFCSAHGERPKQTENREDPRCTRTLAPWFGK